MPAGIVLAGGRSSRMGRRRRGSTGTARRCCGASAGSSRAVPRGRSWSCVRPGRSSPPLPAPCAWWRTRARAAGRCRASSRGCEAVDADVAFVASIDVPFLHPRFVAAVCRALGRGGRPRCRTSAAIASRSPPPTAGAGAAGGRAGGRGPPEARVPVRALRALARGRCRTPRACATSTSRPDYEAARAEPQPLVRVRCFGPPARRRPTRAPRRSAPPPRRRGDARRARDRRAQRRPDRARSRRAARRGRRGRADGRGRRRVSCGAGRRRRRSPWPGGSRARRAHRAGGAAAARRAQGTGHRRGHRGRPAGGGGPGGAARRRAAWRRDRRRGGDGGDRRRAAVAARPDRRDAQLQRRDPGLVRGRGARRRARRARQRRHDPVHDELFSAARGRGASCNGSPLRGVRPRGSRRLPWPRSWTRAGATATSRGDRRAQASARSGRGLRHARARLVAAGACTGGRSPTRSRGTGTRVRCWWRRPAASRGCAAAGTSPPPARASRRAGGPHG